MKLILGAAASALLLMGACGSDGGSSESPATAGSSNNEGGAAGSAGSGDGGEHVVTPVHAGGDGGTDDGETGGVPAMLGGAGGAEAGMGGQGGAPAEVLSDVSGRIQTFEGSPLPDAVVIINDMSTVTDAAGAFTISNVPESYDLTVIGNDDKLIEIVEGMTSRTPVVGLWQLRRRNRTGGVAGKLSGGGGFPLPAGQAGLVSFRGETSGYSDTNLVAANTSFTLAQVPWEGAATCVGSLTGIFWKQALTGPSEYTGFGKISVALEAGKIIGNVNGSVAATNLAVVDPVDRTFNGALHVPGTPTNLWSYLNFGWDSVPLNLAPGAISVAVPEVDVTTAVSVTAEFATASSGTRVPTQLNAFLDVDIPAPPQLVLPVADATGVTPDTEFSWTKPPAKTFSLLVISVGPWSVVRVTSRNKVKLPDLSAAGVAYAAEGLAGDWHLEQYGPAKTPEEALKFINGTSPAYASVITTFGSADRGFQFAD